MFENLNPNDLEIQETPDQISEELRDALSNSEEFQKAFKALKENRKRKGIIKELVEPLEQNQRFVLAVSMAQKKPWHVCGCFENFQPLQYTQRFKIAEKIVCTDGSFLILNFEKFGIDSEEERFELISKMLDKTEEEYKKDTLSDPQLQNEAEEIKIAIAEEGAGQTMFTVHEKVLGNFDKLGITNPEYKEQIENKLIEEVKKD